MAEAAPSKDTVKQEFANLFKADDPYRVVLDRTMMRNILYYLGEQYIDWLETTGTFGRRFEMSIEVPTPVNNLIRDNVRSMKALTLNKDFVARVWPNSEQQKDKDAAELGEHVSNHLEIRRDYEADNIKELVEIWRQITGSGFWRTFPDMGGGAYLVDAQGQTIGKTGDVRTECFIPFNVVVPYMGQFLREKACVGMKSLKEIEWVEDTFKIKLAGGDGQKDLVDYEKQLMTLIANVSPWKGRGLEVSVLEEDVSKLCVYREIEYRPTKDYTEGRYCAMAGDEVVINDTKMPISAGKEEGEWEYTLTHAPYNYTPGSFWPTGSVDDLISPQNITNDIDQTLAINRKSYGRPMVLTPMDLQLKRISQKGSHLLALQYNSLTSTQKPEFQRGMPYPNQVLDERAIHRQAAQDATGDPKNVLRGQSPYAGAPGIAIDMLREAAEQSHTPDIRRFYRAYGQVKRKELMVVQAVYTESRILKITGPGNEILIKKFKGSDLHNNTDIRLELASGIASTNAGRADLVMQLLQYNFFNNPNILPDLQREILKMLGLGSFEQSTNLHKKRAEYENSILTGDDAAALKTVALPGPIPQMDEETGEPIVGEDGQPQMVHLFPESHDPVFRFDDHQLHIEVLEKLIFGREFRTLSQDKKEFVLGHLDMHAQALQEQRMQEEARAIALANAQGGKPGEQTGATGGPAGGGQPSGQPGGGFQVEPFTEE